MAHGRRARLARAWGTTYAANLRLSAADKSADEFVALARSPLRPPMPFFNLRDMTDATSRRSTHTSGTSGPPASRRPRTCRRTRRPTGPFVQFPAPPPAN